MHRMVMSGYARQTIGALPNCTAASETWAQVSSRLDLYKMMTERLSNASAMAALHVSSAASSEDSVAVGSLLEWRYSDVA
jgi:hypothetical protein